jgi:hypothetical protein
MAEDYSYTGPDTPPAVDGEIHNWIDVANGRLINPADRDKYDVVTQVRETGRGLPRNNLFLKRKES